MKLDDVRSGETYFETKRKRLGLVITSDPADGASLLFEPLGDDGDIGGGDIFRTEACNLVPASKVYLFVKHDDGKFYCNSRELDAVVDQSENTLTVGGDEYFIYRVEPYIVHDDPETVDLDHYCLRKNEVGFRPA